MEEKSKITRRLSSEQRERESFSPRRSPGRPPDSCQINIFVEE